MSENFRGGFFDSHCTGGRNFHVPVDFAGHRYNSAAATASITNTKQESPAANARATLDSAVIPRWPSAAILHIIEPEIAPCDPLTPKTLA